LRNPPRLPLVGFVTTTDASHWSSAALDFQFPSRPEDTDVRRGVSKRDERGCRPPALRAGHPQNGRKVILGSGMASPGETCHTPMPKDNWSKFVNFGINQNMIKFDKSKFTVILLFAQLGQGRPPAGRRVRKAEALTYRPGFVPFLADFGLLLKTSFASNIR
jgi:hypothetical protein